MELTWWELCNSRNTVFSFRNRSFSSSSRSTCTLDELDTSMVSVKLANINRFRCLARLYRIMNALNLIIPCTNCCSEAISSCALRSWCWISVSRLYSATTTWLLVSFNSFVTPACAFFNRANSPAHAINIASSK